MACTPPTLCDQDFLDIVAATFIPGKVRLNNDDLEIIHDTLEQWRLMRRLDNVQPKVDNDPTSAADWYREGDECPITYDQRLIEHNSRYSIILN